MFLNILGSFVDALKNKAWSTLSSVAITSAEGRQYAVQIDKDGYLSVNVPWTNDGGVESVATGTQNGTISVKAFGSSAQNVAVYGLGTAAYQNTGAFAAASHNQAAGTITAGTLAGQVQANAVAQQALGNAQVRNATIGTNALTPGISELATGQLYFQYE